MLLTEENLGGIGVELKGVCEMQNKEKDAGRMFGTIYGSWKRKCDGLGFDRDKD